MIGVGSDPGMSSEMLLREIARLAEDKKALHVVELDLRGVLGYTDYFLICSGNTSRQTKAIHDGILEGLKHAHRTLPGRVEGGQDIRVGHQMGALAQSGIDLHRPVRGRRGGHGLAGVRSRRHCHRIRG